MAVNPLLLTCMAIMHANRLALPDQRAMLYDELVKILLDVWRRQQTAVNTIRITLSAAQMGTLRRRVEQIAFGSHTRERATRTFSIEEAAAWLRGTFPSSVLDLEVRERVAEMLESLSLESGLLVTDSGGYQFVHLSFQEFLAACHCVELPDVFGFLSARRNDPRWRKDVTAFANHLGGTIVVGAVEGRGAYRGRIVRFAPLTSPTPGSLVQTIERAVRLYCLPVPIVDAVEIPLDQTQVTALLGRASAAASLVAVNVAPAINTPIGCAACASDGQQIGHAYRFPRRSMTGTRFLRPEELAKTMNVTERRALLDLQALVDEPMDGMLTYLVQQVENSLKERIARDQKAHSGSAMETIMNGDPAQLNTPVISVGRGRSIVPQNRYLRIEKEIPAKIACYKLITHNGPQPAAVEAKLEELYRTLKDPEDIRREQRVVQWDAWLVSARSKYAELWALKDKAESTARPLVEEGLAALAAQNYALAKQKLTQARIALYQVYLPNAQALAVAQPLGFLYNGLANEIAEGLARVAQAEGDEGLLWAQMAILRKGRPWGPQEAEFLLVTNEAMTTPEQKLPPGATDWARVLIPGPGKEVAAEIPHPMRSRISMLIMAAMQGRGAGCKRLKVDCDSGHHWLDNLDGPIEKDRYVAVSSAVTRGVGELVELDLRYNLTVSYGCKETDRVDRINPFTGRIYYRLGDCKYKALPRGYLIQIPHPPGLKELQKGDVVTFNAQVKKSSGRLLEVQNLTFILAERDDQPLWYLGVVF